MMINPNKQKPMILDIRHQAIVNPTAVQVGHFFVILLWSLNFGSSDKDDHREWKFGPLFSSDMIIATARQMMNL
jgi:hypothetical protein